MDLKRIIALADAAYAEHSILQNWDDRQLRPLRSPVGDSLAWFIASELHGTYDPEMPKEGQLATAVEALERAAGELLAVCDALSSAKALK